MSQPGVRPVITALPVGRILVAQLLIVLLCLAGSVYDREIGFSAAAGGMLCLFPNALAGMCLFRRKRAGGIQEEQRRMRHAWVIRWIGTLVGLGLVFGFYREVQPVAFFATYAAAQATHLIGHLSLP